MFNYLELDYKTKKERELRNAIRKLQSHRINTSFRSSFSNSLNKFIVKLKLHWGKTILFTTTVLFAIITAILLLNPIISRYEKYSNTQREEIILLRKRNNQRAFNFLINSGKKRLYHGNISGAYKEFKLAHAIYPDNKELNKLLVKTLNILCEKQVSYCEVLDVFKP
ncbi:hypothetical protein E1J38_009020 [Seonamhaeicola sediminis]|uniref:Uncharacterized protein n=1 Tax=Seonamhaeicola sediminis TaxID=2528206 RepID=A0A562YFC6_9FLAO|nr:hypothetical protein [Seonamhaeicola sediminis]TWO32992.1 hypothetical protein E1J38_009020 [Seonamhaeicola sediminis]